jgi:hypothetical protein
MMNIILEKMRKMHKSIFLSAFFLLTFIFFNISISTVLFIFKVSIQSWYLIISLILSICTTFFFLKNKKMLEEKRESMTNFLISILLPIIIIFTSIFINGSWFCFRAT